jgi:hypothetical protein
LYKKRRSEKKKTNKQTNQKTKKIKTKKPKKQKTKNKQKQKQKTTTKLKIRSNLGDFIINHFCTILQFLGGFAWLSVSVHNLHTEKWLHNLQLTIASDEVELVESSVNEFAIAPGTPLLILFINI